MTKILIIDDNETDVEFICRELKRNDLNFSTLFVRSKAEYESALDHFQPDLILSDWSMPSFSGMEAFKIRQTLRPETPFIIISGTIGEENAVELIKNGVTDYVLKDRLYVLHTKIVRALREEEEKRKKREADTLLRQQNMQLYEIAFMQSHQVRVPVAQILGLYNLFKFDDPANPLNAEILNKLNGTAITLDKTIRDILRKISDIRMVRM